ncbi:shikimate kinase [Candidatus Neptunochlamydia vexilliferae]|uniref:shikimate kinase n=1 Tax=Candidatus Neptunichlamydia vexilliferae TaxID=1651774 RepID=UPI0018919700|nr:shikimate kinase [Candidatus Neptunochlamydia vexilliferae]
MNIVLFGIKGCGKTTFGKLIAQKLERAFIDTDHLIEETYQSTHQKKLTCRDIYKEVGPLSFRGLEYEVIQSLQDVQQSVIAAGGGAMLLYENIEALQKNSHLFYLFCEREKLRKRVLGEDPLPPFIDPNDPDASFDKMYDERHDFYKKVGAQEINITAMEDEAVVNAICKSISDGK